MLGQEMVPVPAGHGSQAGLGHKAWGAFGEVEHGEMDKYLVLIL